MVAVDARYGWVGPVPATISPPFAASMSWDADWRTPLPRRHPGTVVEMSTNAERRRQPTMMDVAALAGVSHQTVSRVVNGNGPVSPDTRRRVEAAIGTLGFAPSAAAKALASGRPASVGVVSIGTEQFGPRRMLTEIETQARERGYEVSVVDIPGPTASDLGDDVIAMARRVAGLIVLAPIDLPVDQLRQARERIPIVVVDSRSQSDLPFTTIDQTAGGRLGVEHLLGLGHRRIALVAGPDEWHDATQRLESWTAALVEHGLEPVAVERGDWSAASGVEATRSLIDRGAFEAPDATTALLVANDSMAIGALHALHEVGLDVPGTVSVVGYDDDPVAAYLIPALTTVRQDFSALASGCLTQLLSLVGGADDTVVQQIIAPELIIRASTAPPGQR